MSKKGKKPENIETSKKRRAEPRCVRAHSGLIWSWVMELFFLFSGVGSWYALKSMTAGSYLFERVKQLIIPLYTVSLFIVLQHQFYFEPITNAGYSGTFREMIPHYFSGLGLPQMTLWPSTLIPLHFSGHLWFLRYLFLISRVTLPLLLYLKSEWGRRWIVKLADWCDHPGGIFLFLIPLALALIGLMGLFRGERSWADFLWYAIYFAIVYTTTVDKCFTEAFKRHGWLYLALWIVSFFGGIGLYHHRDVLPSDSCPVRTSGQALQRGALLLSGGTNSQVPPNWARCKAAAQQPHEPDAPKQG